MKLRWLNKPLPAALILVLLWTCWRLAFLSYTGIPAPRWHDEFSYLLGADTLAHGRLANPSHALGKFFESPHILVRPVYVSMYQPGQALFLALGQILFRSPFYGVLIGNALMLFTISLMLFAWVPPRWALTVSAMFGLCLWPKMYWTNSYWGGSVAASGGALVLLAIGIYHKKQTPLAGAIFAMGILLIFWTRPFEGGVFVVLVLLAFAAELLRKPQVNALVVALSVLVVGCAWTFSYNQAITGNPFRLPYVEHYRQYNVMPLFSFLPLRPQPIYTHPRLAAQHGISGFEVSYFYSPTHPRWTRIPYGLSRTMWRLILWPALLLVLLFPRARSEPLFLKMAIVSGAFLFVIAFEVAYFEHYTAPAWAAFALLIAVWAERMWNWKVLGLAIGRLLVLIALASPSVADLAKTEIIAHGWFGIHGVESDWPKQRVALIERLSALKARQLVIVRYPSPDWDVPQEWVYNGADIDRQHVIFAHDLGPEENRALLRYYPDCTTWLLTFDLAGRDYIEPYPSTQL